MTDGRWQVIVKPFSVEDGQYKLMPVNGQRLSVNGF
jgi:hypothetical protein